MTTEKAPRSPRTAPDVRSEELVAAARELFAEQGLTRTTLADVARRVGVARTLVYHYFPSKDVLVDAVLDGYVDHFVTSVRAWDAARTPGDVEGSLVTAIALFRTHLRAMDPIRPDLERVEATGMYNTFLDRAVRAIVDCLEETTVRAYAARHRIRIDHVRETFYVLVYGLVGLARNTPGIDDALLVALVRQALRLEPEASFGHGTVPDGAVPDGTALTTDARTQPEAATDD